MSIRFRSDMTVELVRHMASDEAVVQAARVSTQGGEARDASSDEKLINFLMRDRHGSPFEHNAFTFYIEAPIFVFREFMRHRIASYNEESGRYKKLEPVFYILDEDRKLRQEGKPGAYAYVHGEHPAVDRVKTNGNLVQVAQTSYRKYEQLLSDGIAREVARQLLPLNIYSSMFVTMNARALMNFLSLRVNAPDSTFPSFPQREIEMVAEKMETFFAEAMPVTYAAFNKSGRVAP